MGWKDLGLGGVMLDIGGGKEVKRVCSGWFGGFGDVLGRVGIGSLIFLPL